ncbi:MAG: serine/threonine protein kinase [bacterium]|nr:serine/threonine protein kinase [bacterium]
MTPERWQQVKAILGDALELPPAKRAAFLEQTCGEDPALRQEVESLLELTEQSTDFIEESAFPMPTLHSEIPGDLATGLRIGHYRALRLLARGGMGSVYLAVRADDFEKQVALKLIKRGMDSEEIVRRFRNERQILANLDHPNIARILDGGTTDDDRPYFVMEYVEGEPIDQYCDARKLSTRERLELFRKVCAALHFAHQNLVVHRDLKPSNILITADGVPKLLDFGIAKLLSSESTYQTLATGPACRPMTLKYASPEQVREQPVTTASDVYSLGVLFYQLLTGRLPCELDHCRLLESMRVIYEEDPTKPSLVVRRREKIPAADGTPCELTPESVSRTRDGDPRKLRRRLSGDVDSIALMAMRKEPQRRYGSAEQFSEDIRRHLQGRPVIAHKATLTYRAAKFARRHKWRLAAAAAMLLLSVGFGINRSFLVRKISVEKDRAEEVVAFLVDLFRASNPDEAKGKPLTAREVLDRGRTRIEARLEDEPEIRATLLETLGEVYGNLGHYAEARELREESLRVVREYCTGDHPELAKAINNLAAAHFRLGDYGKAEPLFREAIAMRRRLRLEDIKHVKSMNTLASILMYRGEYAEAEELYRRGLAIRLESRGSEDSNVTTSLRSLATLFYIKGDFERAEPLLLDALTIRWRTVGPKSTTTATVLSSLGRLRYAGGDLKEAEVLFEEALAIRRERLGEDHLYVALTKKDLASLLLAKGDAATAGVLLTQALEALYRTKSEGDRAIADAESVLGAYLVVVGRYEEAEPCLIESYLTINKQFRGHDSIYTRGALNRIVDLYETWGKPEKAAEYRAVAKRLQKDPTPEHQI